jgi:hypothetical protein
MRTNTKRFFVGIIAAGAILGAGAGTAMASTAPSASGDVSLIVGDKVDISIKAGLVVDVKGKAELTLKLSDGTSVKVDVSGVHLQSAVKAGVEVDVLGVRINGKILATLVACK